MDNLKYEDVLFIKCPKNKVMFYFVCILIVLLYFANSMYTYDNLIVSGIYSEEIISINVLSDYSSIITRGEYIKIDDEKYEYQVLSVSEIISDGINYYQTIEIEVPKNYFDNEVLEINIFYDHEKIIKKIKKLIF